MYNCVIVVLAIVSCTVQPLDLVFLGGSSWDSLDVALIPADDKNPSETELGDLQFRTQLLIASAEWCPMFQHQHYSDGYFCCCWLPAIHQHDRILVRVPGLT